MDLEVEKFKIQKTQMYLQIASVIMSGVLLYVLISSRMANSNASNMLDDGSNGSGD